jgi:hypothetical protein
MSSSFWSTSPPGLPPQHSRLSCVQPEKTRGWRNYSQVNTTPRVLLPMCGPFSTQWLHSWTWLMAAHFFLACPPGPLKSSTSQSIRQLLHSNVSCHMESLKEGNCTSMLPAAAVRSILLGVPRLIAEITPNLRHTDLCIYWESVSLRSFTKGQPYGNPQGGSDWDNSCSTGVLSVFTPMPQALGAGTS